AAVIARNIASDNGRIHDRPVVGKEGARAASSPVTDADPFVVQASSLLSPGPRSRLEACTTIATATRPGAAQANADRPKDVASVFRGSGHPPTPALPHKGGGSSGPLPPCEGGLEWRVDIKDNRVHALSSRRAGFSLPIGSDGRLKPALRETP